MSAVRLFAVLAAFAAGVAPAGPTSVRATGPAATVSSIPLPGGLRGALAALDDPLPPDRGQFLIEVVRRAFQPPIGSNRQPKADLDALLAYLQGPPAAGATNGPPETVPLPLTPAFWVDVVFGGQATPETLVRAIVSSPDTAFLYYGLLALDDETRTWVAGQPALVGDLVARHAIPFLVAAPALRVAEGAVRVPGGEAARPAWEAIVGRPAADPARFVRALLGESGARFAYFYSTMAALSPARIRFLLRLDAGDPAVPIDALRRLHAVFTHLAADWDQTRRAFWRPAIDPALLVAGLASGDGDAPRLPGGKAFWEAAFAEGAPRPDGDGSFRTHAGGPPADPVWICEQVFRGGAPDRRRYDQVLFASRVLPEVTPANAGDALEIVRGAGRYPALAATLEGLGIGDLAILAAAVRAADRLSAIGDEARAELAMKQFQGALAIVARAAARGSLAPAARAELVASLAAVETDRRGAYEGRLVRWLDARLRALPPPRAAAAGALRHDPALGPVEQDVLRLIAGPVEADPLHVEWEGTRYRLDFSTPEASRLARQLAERSRPYLSSARALAVMGEALGGKAAPGEADVVRDLATLDRIAGSVGWDDADGWPGTDAVARYRDAAAALRRAAGGRIEDRTGLASALNGLADQLAARGLVEIVYAAALGEPESTPISASEAASRHDFGFRFAAGRRAGWLMPVASNERLRGWRVVGSLLGLDVRLGEFSLLRLSSRLPARRPSLGEEERRIVIEGAVLAGADPPLDADRDRIVEALRRGRARLAAVRSAGDAAALGDRIGLSGVRRSLLPWVVEHDPGRVAAFLSPAELLVLGLEGAAVDAGLHAWGMAAHPRLGCLCLRLVDRPSGSLHAGRWGTGMLAGTLPDVNLRLAELLAELRMPARLLGPVLASAALDFVNNVVVRDEDDRRGAIEYAHALRVDRVEQYLALLTTEGPLVPVGDAPETAERTGVPR